MSSVRVSSQAACQLVSWKYLDTGQGQIFRVKVKAGMGTTPQQPPSPPRDPVGRLFSHVLFSGKWLTRTWGFLKPS